MSGAYYNEIDPYAAAWLRNLIAAGHIAPGDVDERDIRLVQPAELVGYDQCHFFAGIGVWSHALRQAGWPDDEPVWTGSCPCQPFSAAGKRGGTADERHLWPTFGGLIAQCRPERVFGEQVASKDGLAWLDLVHADLEAAGYSVGSLDLCAAGLGAPHIRQRLFFVAHARSQPARRGLCGPGEGAGAAGERASDQSQRSGDPCDVGHTDDARPQGRGLPGAIGSRDGAGELAAREAGTADRGLGHARCKRRERGQGTADGREHDGADAGRQQGDDGLVRTSEARSFWSDCDWLPCIDGKARPVEPGTFPLAHGAPARVGRLRAYGNAIVAPVAAEFIRAYEALR